MMTKESFELKVGAQFSSAHFLRNYDGDCARLHGHTWKIELTVLSQKLDDLGIGVDFRVIKNILKKITMKWDHQNLNELPEFIKINPTAENLAKTAYLFAQEELMEFPHCKIGDVRIFENDNASVRYFRS